MLVYTMKAVLFVTMFLFSISTVYGGPCSEDTPDIEKCIPIAKKGRAEDQLDLGRLYDLKKSYELAAIWYRKAAEQGNKLAQYNLGLMYQLGEGLEKNSERAMHWYRKSAEQGFALAQTNLGWMYQKAQGIQPDYSRAIKWYRKAIEQGNSMAQENLGYLYYKGYGLPQDNVMAYMLWNLAEAKSAKATIKKNAVAKEMTASEIEKAKGLARDMMTSEQLVLDLMSNP